MKEVYHFEEAMRLLVLKTMVNYLGILELISHFNPFLSQHIHQFTNGGRGHSSYLSKIICDEIVTIMGQKVLGVIKQEIVKSRYFSISVDSTPDITRRLLTNLQLLFVMSI